MITYNQAHAAMMALANELRGLPANPIFVELVGSCAIQGGGEDIDVMVFALDFPHVIADNLLSNGWVEQEGNIDEYGQGEFRSFRSGDINCLLVWDKKTYSGWLASVEMCKHINTKTRAQRKAVHQIIMDGQLSVNLTPFDQLAGEQ